MGFERARDQSIVVFVAGPYEPGLVRSSAPVAAGSRERVLERVAPMLELEIRSVGRRPAGRVDPDPRRPATAGSQQRQVEVSARLDVEAGHAPIENGDRVVL